MKKFSIFALALLFSVASYAQNEKKNLYLIDDAGHVIMITAPSVTSNQTFTFPITGGTVLTSAPSGGSSITEFGSAGVGTPLSGSAGVLKMYNGTDILPLILQTSGTGTYTFPSPSLGIFSSDATGTITLTKGTANQALVMNALGSGFAWASVPSATSTPVYDAVTLGNSTTPTQGILTLYDGGAGVAGNTLTIQAISTLANSYTYTLPDVGSSADFVMTAGDQTLAGNKTLTGTTTLSGTASLTGAVNLSALSASLPLKLDASKNIVASAIALGGSEVTGTLGATNGGTGLSSYVKGDVIYSSATNTLSALGGATVDGKVLTWNNATGLPEWRTGGGSGIADFDSLRIKSNNGNHYGWNINGLTKDVTTRFTNSTWENTFDAAGTPQTVKFDLSGWTAGSKTRKFTLPDTSGTLALITGGTATAPQFETVTSTKDITSTGSAAVGTVYSANQAVGWAEVTSAGVLTNSFGNVSISHTANTGVYVMTLPGSIVSGFAIVTLTGATAGTCTVTRSTNTFTVRTYEVSDDDASLTDYPFNIMIMAR